MENQKDVWDRIANEWYVLKDLKKDKNNLTQENIFEFLKNRSGKVLDFGSGSGVYLSKINEGKMYLIDFSKKMIDLAKKKAKILDIDAEFFISEASNLPFEDNYFDSAIFISVLMCIEKEENREKAMKELYRVLKPKAHAFIDVWNKDQERFKNSPKERIVKWRNLGERYYYLYNEKEVHELFEKLGFKIIKKFKSEMAICFIVEKS